jgi:Fe-S cluster biogenesis protein NfuA
LSKNPVLTKQTDYVSLLQQKYKRKQEEKVVKDKIQEVLNNIRPGLNADGGDVELVDVKDGIVSLRLTGACAGCPFSSMTLKNSIEKILKQEITDIKEVVAV